LAGCQATRASKAVYAGTFWCGNLVDESHGRIDAFRSCGSVIEESAECLVAGRIILLALSALVGARRLERPE